MKKIITLFCFIASMLPIAIRTTFAQNSTYRRDSLYKELKQTQTPAGQVAAWVDISEFWANVVLIAIGSILAIKQKRVIIFFINKQIYSRVLL